MDFAVPPSQCIVPVLSVAGQPDRSPGTGRRTTSCQRAQSFEEHTSMRIDPDKCVACGNCTYVCPMGAIYIDPAVKRATVNRDECVECYACYNGLSQEHLNPTLVRTVRKLFQMVRVRFEPEPDVCPTAAFAPEELTWPRVVRRAFSDPRVPHESTGVEGRGTEEVKTNDVSGRVDVGEVGFTIEFGRPGVGVWLREIQEMSVVLAHAG